MIPSTNPHPEYPGLYDGSWGPTREVLDVAESPLDLFWFFVPKALICTIADESNRYASQTLKARARTIREKQTKSKRSGKRVKNVETLKQIRSRLRAMPAFQPYEYAVLFGLLIARMLCPHKRRLSSHWSSTSTGALPSGTFSTWMSRNRFAVSWGCFVF